MNKRKIAIVLNIIIIVLELISFGYAYGATNRLNLEYYTEDSNLLALVCSSIFLYYLIRNRKIPKWLHRFKLITTICLSITFLVVIFILVPMKGYDYYGLLVDGIFIYHHTLCPLLAIITFLFFDNLKLYQKKDVFIGLSFTFIYAAIVLTLNILQIMEGPYPFLMVYKQSVFVSILWVIIIIGLAFIIAIILRGIHMHTNIETLGVFDDNGKAIRKKKVLRGSEDKVFEEGEHFAVSIIFIENEKGEYLIQELPDKEYSSTGGHVLYREKPINSIIREVKEELGITLKKKDITYIGYKIIDLPIRFLFYIKTNININDIIIDENELYSVEYMGVRRIKDLIKNKQFKESHAILFEEVLKYKKEGNNNGK